MRDGAIFWYPNVLPDYVMMSEWFMDVHHDLSLPFSSHVIFLDCQR